MSTNTPKDDRYSGFELMARMRGEVADLVRRQLSVVGGIAVKAERTRWEGRLGDLVDMVRQDTFKVMIVGQYNRGKSTVVNAMLGDKILPSYATETTAIINVVKFAQEPAAAVYPRAQPGGPASTPMTIAVADLEKYVRVNSDSDSDVNPYVRADVYWPIELCRNGVEIIDSPGLNAMNIAREEETIDYLQHVDAVIMVLDAQQPTTRSEIEFFRDVVAPLGHDDAFWVVNKINLVDEEDRDDVRRAVEQNLRPYVQQQDRIFYVDARGALRAKIEGNSQGIVRSGILGLEANLEGFLTLQRGKAKVMVPLRQLQLSIREIQETVRRTEALLSQNLEELVERAHQAEVPLRSAEGLARFLNEKLRQQLDDLANQVRHDAEKYFQALPRRVDEIVGKAQANTTISVRPGLVKKSATAFVTELVQKVRADIGNDVASWRNKELASAVKLRLDVIQQDIRVDVREFEKRIGDIRLAVTARKSSSKAELERLTMATAVPVVGLGGELARMGIGAAFETALAGGVGAVAGVIAVGVLGLGSIAPFIIIPAVLLVLVGAAADVKPQERIKKGIRRNVADQLRAALTKSAHTAVAQVVDDYRTILSAIATEFESTLTVQVEGLRQELATAVDARITGSAEVQRRRSICAKQLEEMEQIDAAIDQIVDRVLAFERDRKNASPDLTGRSDQAEHGNNIR